MSDTKSTNIVWHEHSVTREEREKKFGHRGCTVWLTGLSGCGKSTLANALDDALWRRGIRSYVLDGDNIRHGLNKDLGFSPEDRTENIRRIGEVAKLFTDAGIINSTAFISPYRADRDRARGSQKEGDFIEVYVKASVEACEKRDTKGLYAKARAGQIPEFTGISAPYEEPANAEVIVDTEAQTVEESLGAILSYLEENGYLG
ncbi:MAG TPA: adenylyl-sulfate kinase [Abditibacteriaceae bacterium]|nr:adenylyl-sulfate kinase [Abditibacteriaceae bacterium]